MSYKIDKDRSLPEPKRNSYPFHEMDVGDSFFVPMDDVKSINRIRSAASQFWRRHGTARFTVTTQKNGYRVFRVS
jgi:hypothetical protein